MKEARLKDKPYRLADIDGLYLLVQPNGRKLWRWNYRYLTKQKSVAFGVWPDVELDEARHLLAKARKSLAAGNDLSAE
ncbi:MAG: Arm DNA-binding domain-containing protein, partial [Sphingopyxis sp.]|nr:Arm DNA-binding domain-containing protein [Sphingopyxis sp.]